MSSTNRDERSVTVKYYPTPDGHWWGEVEGWRGWSVASTTLTDCRERARELLPFGIDERLEARSVMFMEIMPGSMVAPAASEMFELYVPEGSR